VSKENTAMAVLRKFKIIVTYIHDIYYTYIMHHNRVQFDLHVK